MNNYVCEFKKVSENQFLTTTNLDVTLEQRKDAYNAVTIPRRSSTGSAGYDFVSPFEINITAGEEYIIPTGIRCEISEGWCLAIIPRSSFGFKYKCRLLNTVGLIDSDYYHSDNEGHIMIAITAEEDFTINVGDKFCQGIVLPFGIDINEKTNPVVNKRNGGIGSTGKSARVNPFSC